jgi:hypothetical protein
MSGEAVDRLVRELSAAAEAAAGIAGTAPGGARIVEPGPDGRWYLVALEGPAFLCLRNDLEPEQSLARVDEVARACLLLESAEALIDPVALRAMAPAAAALEPWRGEMQVACDAFTRAAERAAQLADWAEDPQRAVASLVALDDAIGRQDGARAAYASFVGATDPLVARQSSLDAELVRVLGAAENAAAAAGLADALSGVLAAGIEAIGEGAAEMTALHVTPLQ